LLVLVRRGERGEWCWWLPWRRPRRRRRLIVASTRLLPHSFDFDFEHYFLQVPFPEVLTDTDYVKYLLFLIRFEGIDLLEAIIL
jgi:hypothetical protein